MTIPPNENKYGSIMKGQIEFEHGNSSMPVCAITTYVILKQFWETTVKSDCFFKVQIFHFRSYLFCEGIGCDVREIMFCIFKRYTRERKIQWIGSIIVQSLVNFLVSCLYHQTDLFCRAGDRERGGEESDID